MDIDWMFWWILIGVVFAIEALIFIVVFWMVKKGGLWKLLMFRLKAGSLIVKADRDNSIEFGLIKKPKSVEMFKSVDERGQVQELPTRIDRIKHHLKDSSKPIHFCVVGQGENINLLEKYKPDQSAHHLNQWGKGLFMEGIDVGKAMVLGPQKDLFGKIQQWLVILQFCMMIALLAMNYIILSNMSPAA